MPSNSAEIVEPRTGEAGFTLVEVIIAILILTIGLMGTAAAIAYAIDFGTTSRNATVSRLLITASIEEIETLRNTKKLTFRQIANVGAVNNTEAARSFDGFRVGFHPIAFDPGADGVNGTGDDLTAQGAVRPGYERQITITQLNRYLKRVEVRLRYVSSGGKTGELTGISYLNDDARSSTQF